MPTIKLNGRIVDYTIRESKRAKRINIRVLPKKGLELVYPVKVKQPTPKELLTKNQEWVLSTLDKVQERVETQFRRAYEQGEIFRYLGEDKTLNLIQKTHGTTATVQVNDETLDVSLPPNVDLSDKAILYSVMESFYRHHAKIYLPNRTRELADKLGLEVNRIFIKNQKTRWGSCSTNKNINLNLRLMMTSYEAIDYIIIHELCHLVHMNHSKAFWSLVGKHNPTYKTWRKWFRENSHFLVL